ncbi:MAG: tetratricopeptide repeat protein [Lachnospiraceae bacterium]|nr:tetratricopeptide repeat protein [Lachnospiraceae bacterium]
MRYKKRMQSVFVILCLIMTLCGCGNVSGDTIFLSAVRDYNENSLISAIEKFEKASEKGLERYSEGELYTYLGHCHIELDMCDRAIEYYIQAVESEPDRVEYVVNLAIAYRQSGDNKTAMELYLQAMEINPDYPELNSSLGSLYVLENDPETAIYYFNRAVELDPSLAVAYGNGALAYAMAGDFEMAEEYLEMSITRGYENAEIIRERIEALR